MSFFKTPVNWFLQYGGQSIGALQTQLGAEPRGRKLTTAETILLEKVFLDSLDLSPIRIKIGALGVFALGGAPFTLCNTIYIPRNWLPPSDSDRHAAAFNQLLVHEAVHVWQFQNGGANYMRESIKHQFVGWRETGSRGAAYDFARAIGEGKTWAEFNPEQQARIIEAAFAAGLFDETNAKLVWNNADYTSQAQEAIAQLRACCGAP